MKPTMNHLQKGFSLVELMIAMLIGSLIMMAIMNLFISTNKTVDLTDGMSRNQEAGRFAMDFIGGQIEMAGYFPDFGKRQPPNLLFLQDNSYAKEITCSGGEEAEACSKDNVNGKRGDRLAIKFSASDDHQGEDCLGGAILSEDENTGEPQHVVNVFWVNAENELVCQVYDHNPISTSDADSGWQKNSAGQVIGAQAILTNVESFQVLVGLAASDDDAQPSRYVTLNDTIDHNLVRSLKIGVLVSSDQDPQSRPLQDEGRTYFVLNEKLSIKDTRIRHTFSSTISLVNAQL